MVFHARPLFSSENVSRRGGEEIACRFCVGGLRVGHVDDDVDSDKRFIETFAGVYIDAARTSEHSNVVSRLPQRRDRGSSGDTRPADNCNTHRTPPLGLIAIAQDSELQLSG